MELSYEQIQSPSTWTLSLTLIPIIVVVVIAMVIKTIPTWAMLVSVISLITYLSLLVYFCLKQRCYAQLMINIIVIIFFGFLFGPI